MIDYRLKVLQQPELPDNWLPKVKHQVRLEVDEYYDDSFLIDLLKMAYQYIVERADIAILETRFRMTLQCLPSSTYVAIRLPRPELVSVQQIKYVDCNGADQIMAPEDYRVGQAFGQITLTRNLNCWPQTQTGIPDAVEIDYTAGKGEDQVPQFMQALRLLVGHWYRHREDTLEVRLEKIPHGVDTLIEQMRPGDEFAQVFQTLPRSTYYRYGYGYGY